jgi:hypothetical protein
MLLQPSIAQLYEECRSAFDNGVLEVSCAPPITIFFEKLTWLREPRIEARGMIQGSPYVNELNLSREAVLYEDVRRLRMLLLQVRHSLRSRGLISPPTSSDSTTRPIKRRKATSGSSPT